MIVAVIVACSTVLLQRAHDNAANAFAIPSTQHAVVVRSERTRLEMSIPNPLDTLTSGLSSIARLPFGVAVTSAPSLVKGGGGPRLVALYDVENSRACRSVRERITELDLVVETVVPAASNSRVFSTLDHPHSLPIGSTIPRLVVASRDGVSNVLEGEADIVAYLDSEFGPRPTATTDASDSLRQYKEKAVDILTTIGGFAAPFFRWGRGYSVASCASSSLMPPRPLKKLVLYSYENNQFCRLVREVLTELDLSYELRSAGKGSARRIELSRLQQESKTQCPCLVDPNTDQTIIESADIIRYLYKTYALWTPPSELLQAASALITPLLKPVFQFLAPLQAGSYKEDKNQFETDVASAVSAIEIQVQSDIVVVYTYSLSPFCKEATNVLDNLNIPYKEVVLGLEWVPGLMARGGAVTRVALGKMTNQTSLPHVFVGGTSLGGLYSGSPGLIPALEDGSFFNLIKNAKSHGSDRDLADAVSTGGGSMSFQ